MGTFDFLSDWRARSVDERLRKRLVQYLSLIHISQAIDVVKQNGGVAPRLVCIIAAPEGVAEVSSRHPDASIHVGVLDRALNARKYILPGLGDFGDRLYGT